MKLITILIVVLLSLCTVICFRCDRKPYGSVTQASPPDGRFKLTVFENDGTYIPEQIYTVQIESTDDTSRFSLFMISAEGDWAADPMNTRRVISLHPGELRPQSSMTARFSERCLYSLEQGNNALKQNVQVYWQAPTSGSGCVTLRAMVAETENLWYEDGAPLSVKICEDMRQPDDVAPQVNYDCQICDEAKYELTFTGAWSRNTHPLQYPENDWDNKFSDLVGASHTTDYVLWSPGTLASQGLQDLAEHANTTQMESEILEKIGDGVRTLIKGKGHGYKKMKDPVHALFRTDKVNHLMTVAIGIYPSPDWFLGVNRFELCREDNTWLKERELNLFPWDAGTDNGVTYTSSNIETFPKDTVARVQMSSYDKNSPFYGMDIKDLHPFGKLRIRLLRTYQKQCAEETTDESEGEDNKPNEETNIDEIEPSRYQNRGDFGRSELPLDVDPSSDDECPLTQWQEWSPCEGPCTRGKTRGYQWRERYHLVDGEAIEKYDPNSEHSEDKEVPKECKEKYEDFERRSCVDDCSEDDVTASRRTNIPVVPGRSWNSKRDAEPNQDENYVSIGGK